MSRCYTQTSLFDRRRLHHLVVAKVSINEMAPRLGRHRSTIYRERQSIASFTARKITNSDFIGTCRKRTYFQKQTCKVSDACVAVTVI